MSLPNWPKFGTVKKSKNYDNKQLEIDNLYLEEFIQFMVNFFEANLSGLTKDEIKEKRSQLPKIYMNLFDADDDAPDFVVANVCMKGEKMK